MGFKVEGKKTHEVIPRKALSLYPLKFEEVIANVLKVKPEPKVHPKAKMKSKTRKKS